jgi:hypothetical protein
VDFILQADRCVVGDPPCTLTVKTARPRDFPRDNYPTDEVLALIDHQDAKDKGIAHGMTDSQVTTVTAALAQMQEVTLKSTVERLTGAVTGLPLEFQNVVNSRLLAIESALNANAQAVQRNTTALTAFSTNVSSAVLGNSDRIDLLEKAIVNMASQMERLASAQEAANSFGGDWEPNVEYAQGEGEPDIRYFEQASQRPPDVTPDRVDSPALAHKAIVDASPEPAPRATGGVNLTQVLGGEQLQLTPTVDACPIAEAEERGMDHDHTVQGGGGSEFKRQRDLETVEEEDSKRAAVDDDLDLWDCTPQLSQAESETMSQVSSETALESPSVQLRPGYTAFVCAQYITAWKSMSGTAQAAVGNGRTAADLLQNGLWAENRMMGIPLECVRAARRRNN